MARPVRLLPCNPSLIMFSCTRLNVVHRSLARSSKRRACSKASSVIGAGCSGSSYFKVSAAFANAACSPVFRDNASMPSICPVAASKLSSTVNAPSMTLFTILPLWEMRISLRVSPHTIPLAQTNRNIPASICVRLAYFIFRFLRRPHYGIKACRTKFLSRLCMAASHRCPPVETLLG